MRNSLNERTIEKQSNEKKKSLSCKPVLQNFDPKWCDHDDVIAKIFFLVYLLPALNLKSESGNLWLEVRVCGKVKLKKVILQFFYKALP